MTLTTSSSVKHVALGMLVPLALAGTCLAAPALADTAAPAKDASTAAAPAADEGTVLSAGGIQITVPGDWSVIDLGDSMKVAVSDDGKLSASIICLDAEHVVASGLPDDADQRQAYFDETVAQAVEGDIAFSDSGAFDDGSIAYLYVIDGSEAETPAVTAMACILMTDGSLTTVTVSGDPTVEGTDDVLNGVLETLALADTSVEDEQAASAAAQVKLTQTVEAAGITFGVPADVQQLEAEEDDASGSVDLGSEDGMLILSVIPDVFEGETLTDDEFDLMVEIIADAFGGEVLGSTTIENDGVQTRLYAFVVEEDGVGMLGSLGFTEVADGTTTCVLGLCAAEGTATDYGAVLDAVYGSIALAD